MNEVLETRAGNVLSLGYVIGMIWAKMLQIPPRSTLFGEMFNIRRGDEVPDTWRGLIVGARLRCLHSSAQSNGSARVRWYRDDRDGKPATRPRSHNQLP